jgi:hypothetical protein
MPKKFYEIDPFSQSHKTFWCKLTHSFCKLDHFIAPENKMYNYKMV